MRTAITLVLLVSSVLVSLSAGNSVEQASELAVIANKRTVVLALTSRELRSILLGERERWPNGQRLVAASVVPDVPETKFLLKQICGMSEADFKRYFMQLAFQGKSATPPRFLTSFSAVKALVSTTPGALGIIRARDVDASVNVIPLDGEGPGQPSYKLAMRQ